MWTVLIPGLFAGYVPWRFFGLGGVQLDFPDPTQLLGQLGIGVGTALLATCIWEFARSGRVPRPPAG